MGNNIKNKIYNNRNTTMDKNIELIINLYLIRHGETVLNTQQKYQGFMEGDLTEKGIEQAKSLQYIVNNIKPILAFSSPLKRAKLTAEIALQNYKENLIEKRIIYTEGLKERNYGIFQGYSKNELKEIYPDLFKKYLSFDHDFVIPEGESFQQFHSRVISSINNIIIKTLEKVKKYDLRFSNKINIVVFTHGGVINVFFRHVLGIPFNYPTKFISKNTSINKFIYKNNEFFLELFGYTEHLSNNLNSNFQEKINLKK